MNKTETIAQEAKRLLETVPAEQWIKNEFSNGIDKCCAIGHYIRLKSSNPDNFSPINCADHFKNYLFRDATNAYLRDKHGLFYNITHVNNTRDINGYTEPIIKDRVIHFLDDMIKAGY